MKKTNEEVLEFLQGAQNWLRQNPNESRFQYAVNKVVKKADRIRKHLQEDIEDLDVEHAMASEKDGEKGKLLRNDRGQFEYTREGMLARSKAIRTLMQKEVEIEPHIATEVPEDLKPEHKELFLGFVIKESPNGSEPAT